MVSNVTRHGRAQAAIIALLACTQLSKIAATCQGPSGCSTVPGTYSVYNVLAAGINAVRAYGVYGESGDYLPNIKSVADCCAACKNNTACNVWNYCDRKSGCYTGITGTNEDSTYDSENKVKAKNFCFLRQATGYYEFKNLKALAGPSQFVSGKIDSRAPKMAAHPPAVPNEWKCASSFYLVDPNSERCHNQQPYCKTVCAGASCQPIRGLYNTSQILNHEVNSAGPYGGENHAPDVWSASQCCDTCSQTKGCNVWNYCWDTLGCGPPGSCTDYVAKWSRPVGKYFGVFPAKCTLDGRFPKDYCILRKADGDLKKLKVTGATGSYSWTSGKVTK